IDKDLIRMRIVPEFSQISGDNTVNGIPGTNVKRVQTTVELREGQTFAIGGLISNQTLTEVSRIPLLGDIPWIGPRVFQSKTASQVETELLVLVSPEIVRPMEPDEVPPLPGYNVTHPSDDELWHRGQTEGTPDHTVYQLAPFGSGQMQGVPQGYSLHNPPPTPGPFMGPGAVNYAPGQYMPGPAYPNGYPQVPQNGPAPYYGSPGPGGAYPSGNPGAGGPAMAPPAFPQESPPGFVPPVPDSIGSGGFPAAPTSFPSQVNRTDGGKAAAKSSKFSNWTNSFRKSEPAKNNVRPAGWTRGR
ncbi:MAG: hypothetical protein WCK86_11795, partial [Planctomycetia bacterium]